jgi:energy-coupling factor transporter ATP-binding protein EcfA2
MKLPRIRLHHNNSERKRQARVAEQKARKILRTLRRSNLIYERRKDGVVEIVTAHAVLIQDGRAYMPFNQIPRGILATRLVDDQLILSLRIECSDDSIAAGRIGNRYCYTFNVGGAEFPRTFSYNTFSWDHAVNVSYGVTEDPMPRLAFPLGISAEKDHVYANLEDIKHLLLGGTTGHGKSTLLHTLICSIIERNIPSEVCFWLADPKRTELALYRKLLRRDGTGYVRRVETEPAKILSMLVELADELDRRQREQERVGAVNIQEFARITGNAMPHIILVVDEIADLIMSREKVEARQTIGSSSEMLLARIARQGRSSGIHLVCGTQHPQREVLTSQVKANIGARIAFSTVDHYKSSTILDDGRAIGLPIGRLWFRTERLEFHQIQSCLIHASQVKLIVDRIAKYGHEMIDPDARSELLRDILLLVETSATQFNGAFPYKTIHEYLNGQIPRDRIQELALKLEQDAVLQPARGKRPRQLNAVFMSDKRAELLESLYGNTAATSSATPRQHMTTVVVADNEKECQSA